MTHTKFLGLVFLSLTACGRSNPGSMGDGSNNDRTLNPTPATTEIAPPSKKLVVFDNDMNLDDWPALLYLLNHPAVDVRAITVTGTGVASCDASLGQLAGARNALDLLELAGKTDATVGVACGRPTPLLGNAHFPDAWRHDADTVFGITLPASPIAPVLDSATDVLIRTLENAKDKVTLITTGPLTNVGEALQRRPDLVSAIDAIYVMGGAVNVRGNLPVPGSHVTDNTTAEWNVYVDPRATNLVLRSGARIKLVPLDGTNRAPVTLAFRDRLGADRTTPSADFVFQYFEKNTGFINSGEFYFWDPMAAAVMTDESLCTWNQDPKSGATKEYRLKVIEAAGPEFGRMVEAADGARVDVCTSADGPRFENLFVDTVNGRR